MVWLLERGELSVGELAEAIDASLQSTSQHLRLMREHGLVRSRREGQTVYYQIEAKVSPSTDLRLSQPNGEESAAQNRRKSKSEEISDD